MHVHVPINVVKLVNVHRSFNEAVLSPETN